MKAMLRAIVRSAIIFGAIVPGLLGIPGLAADGPVPPPAHAAPTLRNAGQEDVLTLSGKLLILPLEGTPYEKGLAHGRALGGKIKEIVGLWKKDLETTYKTDSASFIKALLAKTNFQPAIEKWTPGLLDEVRGIADGAGLDFETIYAYQLIDEIWVAGPDLGFAKCTSIGARKTAGRPAFVSQTLDIPSYYHRYPTVLRIRDRDADLETLILTIPGVVAANGLNSRGVGLCVNAVTQLAYTTDGLPVAFVIRGVLAKKSFKEAAEFLRTIKPAAPQNYLLGGPDGVASFELAGNRIAPFIPFGGARFTYHTNHPLANENFQPKFLERLKAKGWSLDQMKGSCPRFNFLKQKLPDNSVALGLDELKALYRDRNSGINNAGTYACTIMLLGDKPELHITPGRPDAEYFQILSFPIPRHRPSPEPSFSN
jgi:Acyl-coenzyme A:6-aminopenicillanic acid acyl-transferase